MAGFRSVGIAIGVLAMCSACTITRYPQLYPDNDAARSLGPLQAKVVGHGNLNGTATMTLPSGEPLSGRYSISHGGGFAYGGQYSSVYGNGGHASGTAFGSSSYVSGSGAGVLDMMGPNGTTAHCEFMNDNFNGHGNGACQLSNGAAYRMQY
jgi:hypothetical protein